LSHRLLLVRHGVTEWNHDGRFQGHRDAPLAEDGRREARLLGERLAASAGGPMRIVTSPLSRARDTALAIANAVGARGQGLPREDERLMEIGQGEWEGRTHAELARHDAERYARWRTMAGREQPPGGESLDRAAYRIGSLLDEVKRAPDELCLVSHGGILRLAAAHLLGLGRERAWRMDVDNASLAVLSREDDAGIWRLERWNDTAHLLGRERQHVDEDEGQPLAL
jgi:broad specificity phosphatase PhoE